MDKELEDVLRVVARKHFWAFCCYYDYEFYHDKRRFLKQVALMFNDVVKAYEEGRAMRVGVSMPPRAGKSYITTLFAAYWLGRFNDLSVMRCCCTGTLYDQFSYNTRAVIKSERYRDVFPEVRMVQDKKSLAGWSIEGAKQVSYFGAGVGGSIIGFGANLAISDDLFTGMRDALSTTVKNSVKMWKTSEFNSRMERNCPEVFIGTRWVKDDVLGDAIEAGLDQYIKIPALVDEVSFCEDVKTTEEYLKIRESERVGDNDSATWLAEYMQEPADIVGTLLPRESLLFDAIPSDQSQCVLRFAVGDPANKGGDKYACVFLWVYAHIDSVTVYVVDALCNTDGILANTPRIAQMCRDYQIDRIMIEENGLGLAAYYEIARALEGHRTKIIPFTSRVNKEVRILSYFEFIARYFVFRSQGTKEYNQFISDLTSYNKGGDNKHRQDAIDVLSTAAQAVKERYVL